jgi:hypothetical protein
MKGHKEEDKGKEKGSSCEWIFLGFILCILASLKILFSGIDLC